MELRPLENTAAAPLPRPAAPADSGATGAATAVRAAPAAAIGKADPAKAPAEPDPEEVSKVVGQINVAMQALSRNIEFSIDTDSKRTVVKIIDQTTKEVIRQMPSAEALEIGKALEKVQGLLISQVA
ncbi:flagellar protein FlaG [Massilia atriviolacea]|uniref:Flagellar protein FlaG n=1 Tax=Massilia atriviolacea TaxID=2495579 RepID=A0A430HJ32_9BURK|nr:flagellar protein FlaG [Massilia atriviolacea]RSZ57522.1 flagellar protein FlaG [Massilia atriviolacea]